MGLYQVAFEKLEVRCPVLQHAKVSLRKTMFPELPAKSFLDIKVRIIKDLHIKCNNMHTHPTGSALRVCITNSL